MEKMRQKVLSYLKFMNDAPGLFVSALTGTRMSTIFTMVDEVFREASKRATTGVLNDVIADAQLALQPPSSGGKRLKIYYGTQQRVKPPTFILFVNDATLIHFSYERYLENQFRKAFGFVGTPIRLILRERKKEG
jgi:GTP-binding protein